MKKLFVFFFFLLLLTGCGKSNTKEEVAMKCQKAKDYEFYNSTHIIGVYNTEEGEVTKVGVVEAFIPKWEDVNPTSLYKQLDDRKAELNKKYEKLQFTVDKRKTDVTLDYTIFLTEKNLKQMKKDDSYKSAIKGDLFSIVDYWQYLEDNGYVCQ